MASYVVMTPSGNEGDERVEFIRDGFSFAALVVPFVWLAWQRLWLEAALVLLAVMALAFLGEAYPWARTLSLLATLLGLYVALEGGALRVAAFKRRGWREEGIVSAASRAEAEIRWFGDTDTGERPVPGTSPQRTPPPAIRPPRPAEPALGLFSYPGNS